MTHLKVEEIIEFVSFNELSPEFLELAAKVNEHIRECPECLKKVSAYQMVYDELCKLGNIRDIKSSLYQMVDERDLVELEERELQELLYSIEKNNTLKMER